MIELDSDVTQVQALTARLAASRLDLDDSGRIDLIRALEDLKNAAASAQARATADLDDSFRAADAERGVAPARRGRGVASQVALARRESGHLGQQHLGLAKVLREMPCTAAAFRAGRITEWRATLVARETACLSLEHRQAVDVLLAGDPDRIERMGDGEIVTEAKKIAYRLDPTSFVARRAAAEADRHVSVRPAPDVMTRLSALLPVKDGVGVYAALKNAAEAAIAAGDGRSRGQLMADLLVARITGVIDPCDRVGDPDGESDGAGVETVVNVLVSDGVLIGQSDEACHVDGYGPIPADLARDLAAGATWLRTLYVAPATGALVAMERHVRYFPDDLKLFLRFRDRTCRFPWCDAPVRHADHVDAVADGGSTTADNGQGLCAAHNHAKQAAGWQARPRPGPRHQVEITAPTGHTYTSGAPPAREPHYVETRAGLWTLVA